MSFFRRKSRPEEKIYTRPVIEAQSPETIPLRDDMNNYIIVILDSCRFDSFMAANPRTMLKIGPVELRYSYASWTAPSHYNLLMGLLPHSSPPHVFASEYYKKDFIKFNERFGISKFEFKSLIPQLYLPPFLRDKLGYHTEAMVSLPVLNEKTPLAVGFDRYQLMEKHNDMNAMLDQMTFSADQPSFFLLNVGETHYPYALPDEPENLWPRISGVHGIFKHLDDHIVGGKLVESDDALKFFEMEQLKELQQRQIHAVQYLDQVFERLLDMVPRNTFITVTSDHGELFGEEGYFGHGPIMHEKVFQVPFLEGKVR